jgi:hypothetical protein
MADLESFQIFIIGAVAGACYLYALLFLMRSLNLNSDEEDISADEIRAAPDGHSRAGRKYSRGNAVPRNRSSL